MISNQIKIFSLLSALLLGFVPPVFSASELSEVEQRAAMEKMRKELVLDAKSAAKRMEKHSNSELYAAVEACKSLLPDQSELPRDRYQAIKQSHVPKAIESLGITYLRVSERGCDIHLHKGVGRGIGYFINASEEKISGFNYYKSWDHHVIDISGAQRVD